MEIINGSPTMSIAVEHLSITSGAGLGKTLVSDADGNLLYIKNNLSATGAPGVTNDVTEGYAPTSIWLNTSVSPADQYICSDAAEGAAVWRLSSIDPSDFGSMASQDASSVAITGGSISGVTGVVIANAPISGSTKTKVTYDAKGLVTNGADATTADIADSTDRRYCTDAQKTVIGNTSGSNTGDQTITLTGDVTGSGTGSFATTIAAAAVSYSKIQNVSNTDRVLGRVTSGAGSVEEIPTTGSGNVARATSPTFVTPTLGVASCTTINGLTPTALSTGFSIAGGSTSKTLTVDETVNMSDKAPKVSPSFTTPSLGVATCTSVNGVAPTSLAVGFSLAGGTSSKTLTVDETANLSDKAPKVSPSFTTPTLGVASATSINKVAITAPATSATLTIANGATLTASATATVSGTNTGDQTISDATISLTDVTTNNATTGRHGFCPKLPTASNVPYYKFLREDGSFNMPPNAVASSRETSGSPGYIIANDQAKLDALSSPVLADAVVTLTCATGTITLNSSYQTLSYYTQGKMVHIYGYILVDSVNSPTGQLILNLNNSLTCLNYDKYYAAIPIWLSGMTATSNITSIMAYVYKGTSQVYIDGWNTSTGAKASLAPSIKGGTGIIIGGSYLTS